MKRGPISKTEREVVAQLTQEGQSPEEISVVIDRTVNLVNRILSEANVLEEEMVGTV